MHKNVLDQTRLEILKKITFLNELDFYMAGGTALALQIGHRISLDFDFCSRNHFKKGLLPERFNKAAVNTKAKIIRDIDDTFEIQIAEEVNISCFYYMYPLLKDTIEFMGIQLADITDIAAMKLVAISQRGLRRDFIDIYYLMNQLSLAKIIECAQKKYPAFDAYNALRGLLYFADADNDIGTRGTALFDKKIRWEDIKTYIRKEVKKYQLPEQ